VFLWKDFQAKNNNELLKNVGNFTNRCLKFIKSNFDGAVPKYEGELDEKDKEFLGSLHDKLKQFINVFEEIKISDALKVAMEASSLCNTYMQEQEAWVLIKTNLKRCK
jgi:methionyl-tRNA synthetase